MNISKRFKSYIIIANMLLFFTSRSLGQTYNIEDFGAVADGQTINTKAIQTAIDKCSEEGGQVLIPKGIFVSGSLIVKSNTHIQIDQGAVLKGSTAFADYPDNKVSYDNIFTAGNDGKGSYTKALLFAEGARNITLSGKGTIDGSGDSPEFDLGNDSDSPESRLRPCMILFVNCKQIKVTDLFLTNSAYWLQNYISCDGLHLKGLKIYNHTNFNQDAMDIDARNVLIEDCIIDVDDDGICFKNHERKQIVENVIVRNCKISTNCNAIKFGTTSIGGLKNVKISNCEITKASADHIRHWQKQLQFIELPTTVISGIALEAVDGAVIDNIEISDISMKDVQTPIFIVLGNRSRRPVGDKDPSPPGQIKNVRISNIKAKSHSKMASSITAFPGYYVENIQLNNIQLNDMGGGTPEEKDIVLKENPKAYPENRMYDQVYPASGFYIRHAKNISIKDLKLKVRNADYRPALVLDDVFDSKISNLTAKAPAGKTAVVKVVRSDRIIIDSPRFKSKSNPFLQVAEGEASSVAMKNFNKYNGWIVTKI